MFAIPTDAPGFARGKKFSKMGWRGSPTGELLLDDCEVGDEALIGAEDGGRAILLEGLDSERVLMAAESVGVAQGALEAALAYAGERRQFGKPIGEFQLIGAKLADMFAETEACRALTRQIAARIDAGEGDQRASPRRRSCSAATSRCGSRPRRSRCSAATATSTSSRSSASCATRS